MQYKQYGIPKPLTQEQIEWRESILRKKSHKQGRPRKEKIVKEKEIERSPIAIPPSDGNVYYPPPVFAQIWIVYRKHRNMGVSYVHRKSTQQHPLWNSMRMYAKEFATQENAELELKFLKRIKNYY